jgi:thioredoxin:protein disulfide reductase
MLAFQFVHRVQYCVTATVLALLAATAAFAASGKISLSLQPDSHELRRGGQTGLEIWAEIERSWHINGHKPNDRFLIPTEVKFTLPPGVSTDTVNYPTPDRKTFTFAEGKELLVYEGKLGLTTAVNVPADFVGTRVRIEAVLRYQACNDSTCLPPTTAQAELLLPVSETAVSDPPVTGTGAAALGSRAASFDVATWISTRGLPLTLLLVALLGLGLNLTPCVYPLISVTIAYFGTQGRHREARVAGLASLYVLGITLTFSAVGVAAALSGGLFGAALQKPPVLIAIAAVLVGLSLSSFGVYQLQPPAWVMRRVSGSTQGALGALFMGGTMGIVAAPCVGPVVFGLLVFVGSQQSVALGFQLFFALGIGMGLPYLALAMAAGSIKALPRSGEWLVWVERLFGVMLLALAAYFVAPLLPKTTSRLLLPLLIGAGGIYLGFIDRSGRSLRYFRSIQRAVGLAAVGMAAWLALPHSAESAIEWQAFDSTGLEVARQAGRPVVLDFLADWCIPCHEMERTTFLDPAVRQEAARFAMLRADITRESEDSSDLVERYDVHGVPTIIFYDSSGTEAQRLVGYVSAEEMLTAMRAVR